jgi:hypothetical protein
MQLYSRHTQAARTAAIESQAKRVNGAGILAGISPRETFYCILAAWPNAPVDVGSKGLLDIC